MNQSPELITSKAHYQVLDGLRGVAALTVVLFHILEIHSSGDHVKQIINHGYLAVDFFFLLSGYVISYAYDDRWNKMTLGHFFLRRIIRLMPMLVFGSVLGALLFYFQDAEGLGWDGISEVPVWKVFLVMMLGFFLLPVGKGMDIRGWNEMFPLNGPQWSLFFEEIANITYALVLRRISNIILLAGVLLAAAWTFYFALTNQAGDIIGGWTIDDPHQLTIGFTRLAFPFLMGLLMARTLRVRYFRNAFFIATLLLISLLSFPRAGGEEHPWMNGVYECLCLFAGFPFIVWLGAGGRPQGRALLACRLLGDLSYPLYITHYVLIYVYAAWVVNHQYTLEGQWPVALLTAIVSVALAYAAMKWYDVPVRTWLRNRFLKGKK